jgi:hypothetical protein
MGQQNKINRIDIKEFRERGYLQEVNRQFFHPLGLALEIVSEDGIEKLGGIWDYRDDEEGIYYDIKNSDNGRIERFKNNELFIESEFSNRFKDRKNSIGFGIEPIPSLVSCHSCENKFDYINTPESGMGYVNCPKCNEPLTQKA